MRDGDECEQQRRKQEFHRCTSRSPINRQVTSGGLAMNALIRSVGTVQSSRLLLADFRAETTLMVT
jgi:hypothetical protein